MKTSKEKQKKVKKSILNSAIELISDKGYKKSSMSKIAKKAGIGEATIYNYFPTKEHILFEYYYQLQVETKEILLQSEEFSDFSLKEQLEMLVHTELDILLNNRTFILEIYNEIFYKTYTHPDMQRGDSELYAMVDELISISIEAGEIEPFPFQEKVVGLIVEYIFGIVYYWIKDESEAFNNTTIMIDKSSSLIYAVLQSGLIAKAEELLSFVFKTHILNSIKPKKLFKKSPFGAKK